MIKAEKARRNLYEFVKQGWIVLEPGVRFIDGMPVRAICDHLQATSENRIRDLIINVPPGHAKSLLTGVFWPAWVWISHPEARWLFSSYREDLAVRDSVKCRRLIQSQWYQTRWSHVFELTSDQNQKQRFENNRTGYRVVVPIGTGTGERGDYVVVDDPHSVDQAESDVQRQKAIDWWKGSMSTRLNDCSTGHKVVIQQRLHESDLTGDLLATGGYEYLCLPAEFEPERRCTTSLGWSDPRKEAGELLWPERHPADYLERLKRELGSYRYAGQCQQRPSPAEGGILKRTWWRFWRPPNVALPPVQTRTANGEVLMVEAFPLPTRFDQVIQSWDLSFKDTAGADFVTGGVWAAFGADRFLLDQRRERLDMPGTLEAIRAVSSKWPQAALKLVEDKANGPAVVATLRHEIAGLIAVNPDGGKLARAQAVSPQIESGNVYLPHPALAPWVEEFIEECTAFPNGRHDDQVDQMTQALNRLRTCGNVYAFPESEIMVTPFEIPSQWPRAFAIALGTETVAVLWGALDGASGILYLYAEEVYHAAEQSAIVRGIKAKGDWIPGVVDPYGLEATEEDRKKVAMSFQRMGLNTWLAPEAAEAAVQDNRELLRTGQLKVFNTLVELRTEYSTYQRGDKGRLGRGREHMIACWHAFIHSARRRMCTEPVLTPAYCVPSYHGDRNAWMAV